MQIPYLARHFRVLAMDGLGNGRSERCRDPRRYRAVEFARDCLAVMDASGTERAVTASLSTGAQYQLELARLAPERVLGAAFIGPVFPYTPSHMWLMRVPGFSWIFRRPPHIPRLHRWWARYNVVHWREEYPAFVEWFVSRALPEPHSTKAIEDGVGWALETDPETLIATVPRWPLRWPSDWAPGPARSGAEPELSGAGRLWRRATRSFRRAMPARLRRLAGGRLEEVVGAGHFPHARKPVQFNLALRDLCRGGLRPASARRATRRCYRPDGRPRALFVSSPIGLGHAQRDVAIARELRHLQPDLQIDWLAQDPVTRVLAAEGERIHPASAHLANESRHIESESAEHDLHCFHALRRMDEILAANFMLFHDIVREQRYDLWIGDEAWELDYYLHENPREKRVPFAWLTDFVGFLPMDDGDARERHLTADYNADMVDHVAEHPEVRDLALFVGNPEDIVAERLGPRAADDPRLDRAPLRLHRLCHRLRPRRPAAIARSCVRSSATATRSVSASSPSAAPASGPDLLRRVIAAFPQAKERVPELRMIVVAGPRIDPDSLPAHRRTRGGALRAQPLPASRRLRPRGGPGRTDDLDGADGAEAPVPVLPAAPPLRAELPRPPPPRTLRRRASHGLRGLSTRA